MVAEKLWKSEKVKKCKTNKNDSWWKRRIQANIAEWRKNVSRLNERRKLTYEFEKKDLNRME